MKSVTFVTKWMAILLLVLGALASCGEKDQTQSKSATVSKEDVKQKTRQAYSAAKGYTQEQVQAFREQTENKLTEYKKKIDQLQAKAEELGGDAKAKAEQQLAVVRQKRDNVSEKLKDLSSSGGNAWEQIKSGVDTAMDDLASAYKNAAAEFSKP
jgi:cell division septum initiation protein DivIVA